MYDITGPPDTNVSNSLWRVLSDVSINGNKVKSTRTVKVGPRKSSTEWRPLDVREKIGTSRKLRYHTLRVQIWERTRWTSGPFNYGPPRWGTGYLFLRLPIYEGRKTSLHPSDRFVNYSTESSRTDLTRTRQRISPPVQVRRRIKMGKERKGWGGE